MIECPKCGRSVGLILREECKVGAMFLHRPGYCDAVLIILRVEQQLFEIRLTTPEERGEKS